MKFNQPEYKYIQANVIINEVKNTLSSYFDQGTLDESIMYPKIMWCLGKMGLKVYPQKSDVVQLNGKQGKLPLDFYKLNYAIGCGQFDTWEDTNGINQFTPHITEKRIYEIPICKSQMDYCTNECGETYEVIQSFEQLKFRYYDFFNVRVTSSNEYCSNACPNLISNESNEVAIRNGFVFTNFNGSVHIDYLAKMETLDGDILLPDYPQITEWIKAVIIEECFRKLFYNGENAVAQRLSSAQQILTVRQLEFESFRRMNEFQDFYDVSRILKSRYSKYKSVVKGQEVFNRGTYVTVGQKNYV